MKRSKHSPRAAARRSPAAEIFLLAVLLLGMSGIYFVMDDKVARLEDENRQLSMQLRSTQKTVTEDLLNAKTSMRDEIDRRHLALVQDVQTKLESVDEGLQARPTRGEVAQEIGDRVRDFSTITQVETMVATAVDVSRESIEEQMATRDDVVLLRAGLDQARQELAATEERLGAEFSKEIEALEGAQAETSRQIFARLGELPNVEDFVLLEQRLNILASASQFAEVWDQVRSAWNSYLTRREIAMSEIRM